MVLVSHIYKFIYIKNHKVAGSSVESFLGKYCVDPNEVYDYSDKRSQCISKFGILGWRVEGVGEWRNHMPLSEVLKKLPECKDYKSICVIRNPFDAYVSWYYWKTRHFFNKDLTFEEFVKKKPQFIQPCLINGVPSCDYYIRFENLEEDIVKVCNELGIVCDISLLPRHKAEIRPSNTDYRSFYTEELKNIVEIRHKYMIDLFGYSF